MNLVQILTNENPILIKLITILFSVSEAYLFYRIFSVLLDIENKRKCMIFIAIMSSIAILSAFISNSLIRDIISILSFVLSMILLFKQNIKNTFIAVIVSYLCALVSEAISNSIFVYVLNLKLEDFLYKPLYYFFILLLNILIIFAISIGIKKIKRKNTKYEKKSKISLNATIVVNLILGILTMTLETYLFSVYLNIIPFHLLLFILLSSLIYFIISLFSLIRTNILERTTEDLENEKLYNKTLTILHDNIRGFKHDFNNIVQSIGGYVALNDIEGLRKYYEKLLDECKLTNNLNLLNPESINNPSIYSLLTNKYFIANEKNIIMNFSIFSDLSKLSTNIYEISRILGILLDNAIEAAEETEEKLIDIEIKSDDKKHIFIIKNSYKGTNISTTKIFEKGYSTKNRNSGFGLWNVHKILSKNTNLDLFTTIDGNMFSQKFTIYK